MEPKPSSAKALLWVGLCLGLVVVALFLLLGDSWMHWFPDR